MKDNISNPNFSRLRRHLRRDGHQWGKTDPVGLMEFLNAVSAHLDTTRSAQDL